MRSGVLLQLAMGKMEIYPRLSDILQISEEAGLTECECDSRTFQPGCRCHTRPTGTRDPNGSGGTEYRRTAGL